MAQERTSMRKIKEVLRLHFEAQISQAKISSVAKISRSTVQQYIMRFMAAGLNWPIDLRDDELERRLFPVDKGKNNRPEPDYLYLSQEIRKPDATLAVLWEEYKEQHPHGYQYSYFCDLFNAYRKKLNYSMRQEHKAVRHDDGAGRDRTAIAGGIGGIVHGHGGRCALRQHGDRTRRSGSRDVYGRRLRRAGRTYGCGWRDLCIAGAATEDAYCK